MAAALNGCTSPTVSGRAHPTPTPTPSSGASFAPTTPPAATCPPNSNLASNLQRAYEPGSSPDDIAVIDGVLYLSLLSQGSIVAYRGTTGPTLVARGINDPEGLAAGPTGSLYVVEQVRNRIDRVSLDGKGTLTPVKDFANPKHRLGLDSIRSEPNGNILVPDSPNGQLLELDPAAGTLRTIVGGLGRPVDVAPFQDGYAVADESLGLVLVPAPAQGATSVHITRVPQVGGSDDLAVDGKGTLYITGINNGVLYRYRDGRATTIVSGFQDPQGLAIEADGSLLIADSARNALLRLPAACLST